jgi:hypothetical protein
MAIGVHTSSFQHLLVPGSDPVDVLVDAMTACGARECELLAPQIEARFGGPHGGHDSMSSMSPQMMRRELRKWRLRTPPRYFQDIAARFQKAGVTIRACNYSPDASFSDQEIEFGFDMAKALGCSLLTAASSALGLADRIAPFAAQHRMTVAFSGDAGLDPIHSSPQFKIAVDAAPLASANANVAQYVREHRSDIAVVRVSCGQADAQMRQIVDAIAQGGWPIAVFVELHGSVNPVDDVKRCLAALRG